MKSNIGTSLKSSHQKPFLWLNEKELIWVFLWWKREERILQNDTFFFPFWCFLSKKKTLQDQLNEKDNCLIEQAKWIK